MFQAQACGKWIVDVEEFMIKIRDLSHGATGIGSALKASGMVATRNQKIDQDSYLPPFLHLQNLAPYISTELGGGFLCSLPLPHALGTRELTLTSPRYMSSVH